MCKWKHVQCTVGIRAGRCGGGRHPHPPQGSAESFTVKPPASDFLLRLWFFSHIALIFSSKGKERSRCSVCYTVTSILNRGRLSFLGKPMVERGMEKIIN